MKRLLGLFLVCCFAGTLHAAVFTSADGRFTIDLPSGWTKAQKPAEGSVLSVVKDNARIDMKAVPECRNEACIEQKTQDDLVEVKNKNKIWSWVTEKQMEKEYPLPTAFKKLLAKEK